MLLPGIGSGRKLGGPDPGKRILESSGASTRLKLDPGGEVEKEAAGKGNPGNNPLSGVISPGEVLGKLGLGQGSFRLEEAGEPWEIHSALGRSWAGEAGKRRKARSQVGLSALGEED